MPDDERVTVAAEVEAYVKTARAVHRVDEGLRGIEITDPPVVVRTPTGAKVMAWLPVEEEDRQK